MFKKLKAKIEEGGDSGLERVSFSERSLPGLVVRAGTQPSAEPSPSPEPESCDQDEGEGIAVTVEPRYTTTITTPVSEELPSHITSKPPSTYEAILEARIKQLEQDCSGLKERLEENELEHVQEVAELTSRAEQLDCDRTELKLQIVELQLEKGHLETKSREMDLEQQKQEENWAKEKDSISKEYKDKISSLEESIVEKDKILLERGSKLDELESHTSHLQSRLTAFEESTENVVVKRLQAEVADLGATIKSRNIDIQILEKRLAIQTRGSQEEYGAVVDKHFSLESNCKELNTQLEQRKKESRELVRELQKETRAVAVKEKEVAQLQTQVMQQEAKHNQLIDKLEELRSNHEKQVFETDKLVLEKDERISELLTNLKQLRGEGGGINLPDGTIVASVGGVRPPGIARRTATIGTQTQYEPLEDSAVLPVDQSVGGDGVVLNGGRATMSSLSPQDELAVIREDQLRLEAEVSEKNKIIRVQQQKILDMKKTLTKELQRSQSIPELSGREHSPSPQPRMQNDVNFQYLKYVVLKFISSREEESSQLIRALSTLLEFSPQEEKYVKDYLDYKMSWFGSQPTPLRTLANK